VTLAGGGKTNKVRPIGDRKTGGNREKSISKKKKPNSQIKGKKNPLGLQQKKKKGVLLGWEKREETQGGENKRIF